MAQDYLVTINQPVVPSNPVPNTADWGTGGQFCLITATARTDPRGNLLPQINGSKILVAIKRDDTRICGTFTPQTAPESKFNSASKSWTGRDAVNLLGQDCTLAPGEYTFCVRFYDVKGNAISNEVCKPFTIRQTETASYQPPQAISPADGTVLKEEDIKKPVTFRWTPVTPKPPVDVNYNLRIFEVRQGQTATAAKSAVPLLAKEVKNQTQFILPSLGQLVVAKGSSYGWYVQATDPRGNPVGGNNGMSGVMTFKIIVYDTPGCIELDTLDYNITCTGVNSSGQLIFTVSDLKLKNTSNYNGRTGLSSTPMSNVINPYPPGSFTISILTPSGGAIINANSYQVLSFNIVGASGPTASFNINSTVNLPSPAGPCDKVIGATVDLPPCLCTDCEDITWNFGEPVVTTQTDISPNLNNIIYLSQNINVTPVPIIRMKAEIVNLYWYSLFNDCKKCNTNSYYWGNLTQGTLNNTGFAASGFPPGIPGGANFPNSHELLWNTPAGQSVTLDGDLKLNISIPPQTELSCCIDCFRFGIRYSITFIEEGKCITCSNIKFYEVQRQHHQVLPFSENGPDECGETGPSQE